MVGDLGDGFSMQGGAVKKVTSWIWDMVKVFSVTEKITEKRKQREHGQATRTGEGGEQETAVEILRQTRA